MKIEKYKEDLEFLRAVEPLVIFGTVAIVLANQTKDKYLSVIFLFAGASFLISILYIYMAEWFEIEKEDEKRWLSARVVLNTGHFTIFVSFIALFIGILLLIWEI